LTLKPIARSYEILHRPPAMLGGTAAAKVRLVV